MSLLFMIQLHMECFLSQNEATYIVHEPCVCVRVSERGREKGR